MGAASRRRLRPLDGAAMAFALAALGAAGPTWSRVPDPFAAQSAPVAAILKVAPSMTDLCPRAAVLRKDRDHLVRYVRLRKL